MLGFEASTTLDDMLDEVIPVDRAGNRRGDDLTKADMLTDSGTRDADARGAAAPSSRRTVGRGWLIVHAATLLMAAVILSWANRNQWFFGDEWEFLLNRGFVDYRLTIWIPHNEHWSTVPIAVYTSCATPSASARTGPSSAVLIAVHLLLTHLLWRVMIRARVSPAIATAAARRLRAVRRRRREPALGLPDRIRRQPGRRLGSGPGRRPIRQADSARRVGGAATRRVPDVLRDRRARRGDGHAARARPRPRPPPAARRGRDPDRWCSSCGSWSCRRLRVRRGSRPPTTGS